MKTIFSIISLLICSLFIESTYAMNVTSHSSIQYNCNGGTFPPLTIYGNQGWHLWDRLNASGEGIISSTSEVSVFIDSNKINIPNGWVQASNYVPTAGQFYTMWNNNLTTLNLPNLVPADRDRAIGQLVFKIRRMYVGSNNTYGFNGPYIYSPFTGAVPVQTNLGNLNKKFDISTLTADEECMTIVPRWCGDGVVDATQGEQCDAGAQNGQPNSGCSLSCAPVVNQCVAGTVTGPQASQISASTPGLCQTGAVGNFVQNVVGNNINYSWSCNGVSGGNCNASFTQGGGIGATCNNLAIDAGSTALNNVVAGTVVNFVGSGSNLGANPIYRLVITNTDSNTSVTLTGSTNSFTYTIPATANYSATLFIDNTPNGTVGGVNGCVGNLGSGGSSSSQYFACTSTTPCQTYATRAQCELLVGPGRCYLTENQCNANAAANGCSTGPSGGPSCGDGTVQTGEQCDLGSQNGQPGSGCSISCTTSGGGGGGNYCGDGIIQRPNAENPPINEECDTPAPWCVGCRLTTITNPGEGGPGQIVVTNPGERGGTFNLSAYKIIIGDGVPLFGLNDTISFESSEDIYLGGQPFGVKNNADDFIRGSDRLGHFPAESGLGRVDYLIDYERDGSGNLRYDADGKKIPIYRTSIYPHSVTLFNGPAINHFVGETADFGVSEVTRSSNTEAIYPSQGTGTIYVNVGYIEEALPVRVTKNIVSNVAGGNAYVYNPVGFSVDYVVDGFINRLSNGNFITNSSNKPYLTSKQNLSSLTSRVVDDEFNSKIDKKNTGESDSIIRVRLGSSTSGYEEIINNLNDFNNTSMENLGDNRNVRVLKNGSLKIESSTSLKLKGVKTIIIERGDLVINNDILYDSTDKNASWAFIVKNGNIRISKDVKRISGTFLAMNLDRVVGKGLIESSDGKTSKQLVVDGSLYGNSESLSKDRTYVRGTEGSTSLATGIIINYSNRSLKNPPPMLTYFVELYNQKRVAK